MSTLLVTYALTFVDSQALEACVLSVDGEIEEMKRKLGAASDSELAAVLGFQRSTIAQWKKRGAIPVRAKIMASNLASHIVENNNARWQLSSIAPAIRQISRAISLKYIIQSTEEYDLEPDGLIARAAYMDEIERSAYLLLKEIMKSRKQDAPSAFRFICSMDDFETELTKHLMPARMRSALPD